MQLKSWIKTKITRFNKAYTTVGVRIRDVTDQKGYGCVRRLTSNLYNIGDPLGLELLAGTYLSKDDARLRMDELRGLHRKVSQTVLKEYYSILDKSTIHSCYIWSYKQQLKLLNGCNCIRQVWLNGIKFVTDTKGMTRPNNIASLYARSRVMSSILPPIRMRSANGWKP